jgi:hypothetical protein
MEPQAQQMDPMLVLGLQFLLLICAFYVMRRINMRMGRKSHMSMSRLLAQHSHALKNIRRIEEQQWHARLSGDLRISRFGLDLSRSQQDRLAEIDAYQERRLTR